MHDLLLSHLIAYNDIQMLLSLLGFDLRYFDVMVV